MPGTDRRGGRRLAQCAVAATLLAPAPGWCQDASNPASASGQAAAEALFVEGKQLVAAGDYSKGCAKLAASERLDPAAGTLLNLADCYEQNGQLASAWVTFREAATVAQREGRASWTEQAVARAHLLVPRMHTLTLVVDPNEASSGNLEILRDGAVVSRSAWGSAIPLDASTERIEARAPGKEGWTTTITLDDEHPHVVVQVPPLEPLPPPPALPAPPPPDAPPRRPFQKPLSFAVLGAGGVAAGLGVYFGLTAISKNKQAAALCPTSPQCTDSNAVNLTNDAHSAATASTGSFIGGAALLGAGAFLFFTAPSAGSRPGALRSSVSFSGNGWSASLGGEF